VLLLIEVSETTLPYDRGAKLPLYAQAGIREVWIVDLPGETIERYISPSANGYRRVEQMRRGQTLESTSLPGLAPSVDEVLA
jgi:Uma2 family endonuclease